MTEERTPREPRMKDVPRNLKPYFVGLLRKGANWNQVAAAGSSELVPQQLAFLREQMESRRYLVAGPALDHETITGVVILEADTAEAALAIVQQDPGVLAGTLTVEIVSVLLPALDAVTVRY